MNQIVINILIASGSIFYLYIIWRVVLKICEKTGKTVLKYSIVPMKDQVFISPVKKEEGPWQRREYARVIEVKDEWVLYNEGYGRNDGVIVEYMLRRNPCSLPVSQFLKEWEAMDKDDDETKIND